MAIEGLCSLLPITRKRICNECCKSFWTSHRLAPPRTSQLAWADAENRRNIDSRSTCHRRNDDATDQVLQTLRVKLKPDLLRARLFVGTISPNVYFFRRTLI
jgi:hypothetical protein